MMNEVADFLMANGLYATLEALPNTFTYEKPVKVFSGSLDNNCNFGAFSYYAGRGVLIGVTCGRYCSIGDAVTVLSDHPTNFLSTHPFPYLNIFGPTQTVVSDIYNSEDIYKEVHIGHDVWIGSRVLLRGGIKIGNGAIVGAGSVVTKDVEPYAIVGGVPAKFIRWRFDEKTRNRLLHSEWWRYDLTKLELNFSHPGLALDQLEKLIADNAIAPYKPGFSRLIKSIADIKIETLPDSPAGINAGVSNANPPLQTVTLPLDQPFQHAIACHQAGLLHEAGELYRGILQSNPNHPEANHNMGVLAGQMNQPAAGLPYFLAALEARPECRQYWLSYIDALIQACQTEDARQFLALARQQGLRGDEVDALELRLSAGAPVAEQTEMESPHAAQAAIPAASPAPQDSRETPSAQEINALLALFNEGRHAEAASLAQAMTVRFPLHPVGWKMLGVVFNQTGRNAEALAPMQTAAALAPDDAEAHNNLGIILNGQGRLDEAEACYLRALQINPAYAQAHCNLGAALQELGRLDEAEASYRRALQSNPQYAKAHCNLGAILQELGRVEEAEASYRRALQIAPDYADAHSNLGNALKDQERLEEAEASYRRALRLNPDYAEAHYNLGNALQGLERLEEAEAGYRRALQIKPDYAEAHYNLGNALKELGRLDEAEAGYRRALQFDPNYADAHYNLGNTLQDLKRLAEAEASYRRVLAIKPDDAKAHNNLGNSLKGLDRLEEAEASYRRALQIKPDYAKALSNLAGTLHDQGRLAEAEACCRRALEIAPEYAPAHQNLATTLAYLSDYDQVVTESDAALSLQPDAAVAWEQRLYAFSYHPDLSAEEIYAEFVRWGDRFPDPAVDFGAHDRTLVRRLRVGYVSPDFRRHTSRFYFWPLFANHDHAAVELYAYSNVRSEDDVTRDFKGLFDHWRDIRGLDDDAAARMIREDGIDILVDGCSHMRDDRLGVFTRKPAPIQVTWLGAAWTTGLKMIDYALIDPYMAPEGTLTRETIVRLPHSFVAYRPPEETAEMAPAPCLKNGYITFGYSGRTERLNHHTFRAWGEILRQNPTAKLILDFRAFADPLTQAHYRQFMARHGMDPDRVVMRQSANIFAGLNDIDILLDSFPHSGGTMLFDALWMGVPALTLASRPPVGRIGTSLMINLGLPEWVAENQEEYIAKAGAFARNPQAIAQLRAGMRQRMQDSPLMDGPGFARGVESAYREMFAKWVEQMNAEMNQETNTRMSAGTPTVEQMLQQAIAHHQEGRLQEAEARYREILEAHPDHPEANHNLGVLAVQMKLPAAGLPHFLAALEADPTCRQYWLSYIDALLQAEQAEDARQMLALARQQGLQGDEVSALELRMEGAAQPMQPAHAEKPQAAKEAISAVPAAPQEMQRKPGAQEIDALITLFNEGRYTEAATLALAMTDRFPLHEFGWKALGAMYKQMGRSADALEPMQKAAALSPGDVEAHYNLGVTLQELGRLDEAEATYLHALEINPDYADAHINLGVTLHELGRLDEAEASLRRGLQIKPEHAEAHSNLGVTLHELGRLAEAEASLLRSLQISPNNAATLNNLGNTLHDSGRLDEAVASYRRAVEIKPDFADAHHNLGKILKEMGQTDEAMASCRRALQISPDSAEAHYNLGNTFKDMGQLKAAEDSYRRALQIKPDFAEAHSNLGVVIKELGRLDEAEASYRRALQAKPDYARAHSNLGTVLQEMGRLTEAEASYRRALQIKPDYAEAHSNLGSLLQEQRRLDEAVASYRRAVEIKPDFAEAHSNLAGTLHELGQLAEAEACCRRALEIAPEYAPAHQNLATTLAYLSDYDQVVTESDAALSLQPDAAVAWEQRLYAFSYHPDLSAEEIYAEFVRWGDRFPDPAVDFGAHDRTLVRRLRVGYVSPDFRRHTSRFYFWPLFANHDHAAVELYAYSNVRSEDDVTRDFKGLFDHWRDIRGLDDDAAARMIREDGIDILVDGCSHMRDDRLGVFTRKPAPIQVTWLGAAWTTGLKMIDYALIDPYMAPEGTLTRETIVRLPHSFVAYRPPEETAEMAPAPCLKNGYITFGYSGRTERLNHHTFRAWGEILRQNPTAKLILDFRAFADPLTQAHYRQFMARHGMDPDRVVMRQSANIFAGLNDIDILLDSFPHSGGTMLFDALWMGVPALTLASRPPVGRIGTSLMINLGLPEWVAENQEEYIAKAGAFARNPQAIAQLRAGMRQRMQDSPLMDGPGFARGVESAYREMFEKWVKGQAWK